MSAVIADASQLTREYLREVMAQHGEVISFTVAPSRATNSLVARIHLKYDTQRDRAPDSLFLKCVPPSSDFGSSEVDYYRRDYAGLSEAPILACYDAAYDAGTGAYHLLLQDVSDTHRNGHATAPTLGYALALADALAKLHAPYFSIERMARIGEHVPDRARIQRYLDVVTSGIEPMLAAVGDDITPQQHRLVQDAARHHPGLLLERAREAHGMTLVHGDANPGNILAPVAGPSPIYLIDRQPFDFSLTVWLGVSDLAYAMVHWWDPPLRREFEMAILRRYRDALLEMGIATDWDRQWRDYRLCAIQSLYVAADRCTDPEERIAMRWVWRPQLLKTLAAMEDLHCAELWRA